MKTTTLIVTLLLTMVICPSIYAQNLSVRGGFNLASIHGRDLSTQQHEKWKPGIHIGLNLEVPVYKNLSFLTGLNLSGKGSISTSETNEIIDNFRYRVKYEHKLSMIYLEVPISMRYRIPINENSSIYTDAGCYLGFAIAGKEQFRLESTDQNEFETGAVNWKLYKRLDFGLTCGIGFEIYKLQIGCLMDYGLMRIIDLYHVQNQNLRISIAYQIYSAK